MTRSDFWLYRWWVGGKWYRQRKIWTQSYCLWDEVEDHRPHGQRMKEEHARVRAALAQAQADLEAIKKV